MSDASLTLRTDGKETIGFDHIQPVCNVENTLATNDEKLYVQFFMEFETENDRFSDSLDGWMETPSKSERRVLVR